MRNNQEKKLNDRYICWREQGFYRWINNYPIDQRFARPSDQWSFTLPKKRSVGKKCWLFGKGKVLVTT
jgi:hypothetical protein